jgi:hypothetical protein
MHESTRFANYFFQVSLGDEDLISRILPDGKKPETKKNPNGLLSGKIGVHPIDYHYKAQTSFQYPYKDISENERFPPYLPMVFKFF